MNDLKMKDNNFILHLHFIIYTATIISTILQSLSTSRLSKLSCFNIKSVFMTYEIFANTLRYTSYKIYSLEIIFDFFFFRITFPPRLIRQFAERDLPQRVEALQEEESPHSLQRSPAHGPGEEVRCPKVPLHARASGTGVGLEPQ